MRIFNKKILKLLFLLFIFVFICYIISIIFNKQKISTGEVFESPNFPPIKQFNNVLTKKDCQQIINFARPILKRSTLGVERKLGGDRTSETAWIKKDSLPCVKICSDLVAKLTGLPAANQEDWQVLRYQPGQEYKPHFDACEESTEEYEKCVANEREVGWGKRVHTFFIYLNDVEEGGETHFPLLNKSFKPKCGSAIFWNNLTPDQTKAHPYSKHAGMPVKKGEKWAINVWVRQNPRHKP